MVRASFKPVAPDQRIRELRKENKAVLKLEPGAERAERLAALVRLADEERQLNMAMHAAQLCLAEDPEAPTLLVAHFLRESDDPEELLRDRQALADLARYVDRPDVRDVALADVEEIAREWVRDGDEGEQRHRLRRLASIFDRTFSDDVRDSLR